MPAILKSIVNGAMVVFTLATPVHGQGCLPWMWGGCYEQPQYQTEPRRQHTRRSVVHREHRSEHRERREPEIRTVTKTKIVHQTTTWKDMSQDKAREWIKEQAQSFCGKYPKDEACVKKE